MTLSGTRSMFVLSGLLFNNQATNAVLEKILLDLPPTQLFALRRVNSNFRNLLATSLPLRQRMLIAPMGRLSLLKLTNTLRDEKLSAALYPFSISQVHIKASSRILFLTLALDRKWSDRYWRYDFEGLGKGIDLNGSWGEICIEHPNYRVVMNLHLEKRNVGEKNESFGGSLLWDKGVEREFFRRAVRVFEVEDEVSVKECVITAVNATRAVREGDSVAMEELERVHEVVAKMME